MVTDRSFPVHLILPQKTGKIKLKTPFFSTVFISFSTTSLDNSTTIIRSNSHILSVVSVLRIKCQESDGIGLTFFRWEGVIRLLTEIVEDTFFFRSLLDFTRFIGILYILCYRECV